MPDKKSQIQFLLSELAASRGLLLAELDGMSPKQLAASQNESWSAVQVIEHIMWSETGTLGYMKKKTSSGWEGLLLASEEENLKSSMLNNRLASDERYKAPAILPDPEGKKTLQELVNDWNLLREDIVKFVNDLDENFYDRLVFKQPIAGPLSLFQTLQFLNHHMRHHIPQIKRIKEAQGI